MAQKEETKIISIVGVDCCEVAYFMGRLLAVSDLPVLVIDNSRENSLFGSLWKTDSRDIVYRNITFTENIAYVPGVFDSFAYIVVYHGIEATREWWYASHSRIVVTDFDKYHSSALADSLKKLDKVNLSLIFKDRYSTKIKDMDLVKTLGLDTNKILYSFEFPVSEEDKARQIEFQYNGVQKLNAMSKGYISVIGNIYMNATGQDKKSKFQKLVSAADNL